MIENRLSLNLRSIRIFFMFALAFLMAASSWARQSYPSYIDSLIIVGEESADAANETVKKYTDQGFVKIDQDLNAGAGGDYIYLLYRTSNKGDIRTRFISDIMVRSSSEDTYTDENNGCEYHRIYHDGSSHFKYYKGNVNSRTSSKNDYWIYYSKGCPNKKQAITGISFNSSSSGSVSGQNLNEKGDKIYMHLSTANKTNRPETDPQFNKSLTYNGKEQNLIKQKAIFIENTSTMYYSFDQKSWTSDISKIRATDAGKYIIYYYAGGNDYSFASAIYKDSAVIDIYRGSVTLNMSPSYVYGTAIKPTFSNNKCPKDEDYKYYKNSTSLQAVPTEVGSYSVVASIKSGNCQAFSTSFNFSIMSLDISNVTIPDIKGQTYDGSAICPEVALTHGDSTLVKDRDYTVVCESNTDVTNNATWKVTGKGNFTGSVTKTFEILPKSIASESVSHTAV